MPMNMTTTMMADADTTHDYNHDYKHDGHLVEFVGLAVSSGWFGVFSSVWFLLFVEVFASLIPSDTSKEQKFAKIHQDSSSKPCNREFVGKHFLRNDLV